MSSISTPEASRTAPPMPAGERLSSANSENWLIEGQIGRGTDPPTEPHMAGDVPEFYCRSWSGFSSRWIAYVDGDKDYGDKLEMLGPVSINGKLYRCTGVLISVMNHRAGQQLFKGERIGLEVEAP